MSSLPVYGLIGLAGILTHVGYFNRSEHHFYGVRYLQLALVVFATITAALVRIGGNSLGNALATASALEGSYLAGLYSSLLTYRMFFHPLNKFPGPIGARLTDFYYSWQVRHADAPHVMLKLHEKYGDFVRVGSNALSIVHPEGPNAIHGLGSKCSKAPWYDLDAPLSSMHTTRSRALHDRRRRVWSTAFSDKALRGYEDRIKGYGDQLIRQLTAFSGQSVNASKWFNLYSFDVMGDLAFNKSFDMLQSGEEHWAIKLLNEGMEPSAFNFPVWFFRILAQIPGLSAGYHNFIRYCSQRLDERMEAKVSTPDIVAALIDPFKGRKPVGDELSMLQGDTRLLIVAGSDTTAATLTHAFYYLAKDPSQMQKLREELTPLVESDGHVLNNKVKDAEHLNAVISETLRLSPPVPTAVHRLTPREGITIGETHIPGNADVWCPQYVVSRNEEVYADAKAFYPERWYSQPDMIKNKTAYAPFGQGVYGCIGKPLALIELRTVLTKLVMAFDVAFAPGETGRALLEETRDHFTLGLADLNLVFTPRKA